MTTIKSIIRSVSALKPQIVRVSAIRPCIAQAAPELLSPPHLKVHASHPWLRGTGIHASAAQSSSRSSAIEPANVCYPCASMQSRFGRPALKWCAFRTNYLMSATSPAHQPLTSVGFFTSHLLPPHKQPTVPQ
jgi:hypothetical protein